MAGGIFFDFDDTNGCAAVIVDTDIRMTNSRGTICVNDGTGADSVHNGTPFCSDTVGLTFTHDGGLLLLPFSVDLAERSRNDNTAVQLTFIGTKPDGSTTQAVTFVDGVADGPGGTTDFQHYVFPHDFGGFTKLEVIGGRFSFDNFNMGWEDGPSVENVDQQQLGSNDNRDWGVATQTFTPSRNANLYQIGVKLSMQSGARALELRLFNTDLSGTPTGLPIRTALLGASNFNSSSNVFYEFEFDPVFPQVSGETLAFSLVPGAGTGFHDFAFSDTNPYAAGSLFNDGAGQYDLAFYTQTRPLETFDRSGPTLSIALSSTPGRVDITAAPIKPGYRYLIQSKVLPDGDWVDGVTVFGSGAPITWKLPMPQIPVVYHVVEIE